MSFRFNFSVLYFIVRLYKPCLQYVLFNWICQLEELELPESESLVQSSIDNDNDNLNIFFRTNKQLTSKPITPPSELILDNLVNNWELRSFSRLFKKKINFFSQIERYTSINFSGWTRFFFYLCAIHPL